MSTPEIKKTSVTTTVKKDISESVLSKIDSFQQAGQLTLPNNYSPENALKSAYLVLMETKNSEGKFVLDHCSKESIANSLLKMVVWGLSPLKKQCYFIMYGDQLDCIKDYTGNIALAKRYGGLKDIKAHAVFEGDDFAFEVNAETGRKKVTKHVQTLESMSSLKIKGAYAVLEMNDGTFDTEIMSLAQIEAAWKQGATNGNSPAHRKFPDRMARKTAINRGCDTLIRSSDDSVLFNDDNEERKPIDRVAAEVKTEIKNNANAETLDIEAEDITVIDPVIVGDQNKPAEAKKEVTGPDF